MGKAWKSPVSARRFSHKSMVLPLILNKRLASLFFKPSSSKAQLPSSEVQLPSSKVQLPSSELVLNTRLTLTALLLIVQTRLIASFSTYKFQLRRKWKKPSKNSCKAMLLFNFCLLHSLAVCSRISEKLG